MTDATGLVPGTAGYGDQADFLAEQYESVTFDEIYGPLTEFIPGSGRALDIGAGTGRDAAALAARGFQVLAVEPTTELRAHGQHLHPDPKISWLDDSLPELSKVRAQDGLYDLILMTAVWMHLDTGEQDRALSRISSLLAPMGIVLMSVRRGTVPAGRRMFEVPVDPLIAKAHGHGLTLLGRRDTGDMFGRNDVTWSKLAFKKMSSAPSSSSQTTPISVP
ncbi:class I SAM-dependent methyltransferase [Microvirga lenta]|uniref:class I SAM-dependent methyltransferase n=1 Tax=Microvirga lenta TaxID=2881337 RepID=UPI001CFDA893|nr:class I SAM-dependent methyltransferase [Microvirga lenta]MCB5174465.1 class I SAM-dependent methyltransferase [Microvirga lenta]